MTPARSLSRLSSRHGFGSGFWPMMPAVHWLVERVHRPATGIGQDVAVPSSACRVRQAAGLCRCGALPESLPGRRRRGRCRPSSVRLAPGAGALLVVGHRRDVGVERRVGHALDVVVEPAQLQLVERAVAGVADLRARGALQVVPRTDDHLGRDAALAQVLEEQRGAALEQVVLAADQERRHVDLVDHVDRRALRVERPVVRRVAAGQRLEQQSAR